MSGAAASADDSNGRRQAMQNWELFPLYVPASEWEAFRNAGNTVAALDGLLGFLLKLGLRTPSEPTQAILTALLILRDDPTKVRTADGLRSLFCALEFQGPRQVCLLFYSWCF